MDIINWENIPNNPGVYLWKNKDGQVIYVGKAKNLKKRMKQYFNREASLKNKLLVSEIRDFDFQITSNEINALVLEENLINEYEPKFNIKIKGSKIYPYIEVSKGETVTIRVTKKIKNKNSKYFGPYPDGFSPRKVINLLHSSIPIDKCYAPRSGKECLNYTMGKCLGYCVRTVSDQEKEFIYKMAIEFLSGKTDYIKEKITKKIENFNELMKFEESIKMVEYLKVINKIEGEKNNGFNDSLHRDAFNFYLKDGVISISIMHIRFGNVSFTTNYISEQADSFIEEELESLIQRYYIDKLLPDEILVPFKMSDEYNLDVKTITPIKGLKKDILNLVGVNAESKYYSNIDSHKNKLKIYNESLEFLKSNLNLKEINLIEMVDISSTMGKQQVGAVVSFKNGSPDKSGYRKYIIKDTNIMDDYASTNETTRRHFKNKISKNLEMPDIFIVDGKYQLTGAKKIIDELGIVGVAVVALKKDNNHKTESLFKDDYTEIQIINNGSVYLFLSRIQDEAHRFVINFHRSKRNKEIIESELDKFTFLNKENKNNLFLEFKSIRKILIASKEDLEKIIGIKKTKSFLDKRENL